MDDFDISSMISPVQFDKSKCYKYTLQCVVNHQGGLQGGHYFTYCKDEESGKWFEFNDTHVEPIQPSRVVTPMAYILYYIRQDIIVQN